MRYWEGQAPPAWIRQIANERPRPLVGATPVGLASPQAGDIVLKPCVDADHEEQLFRLETWDTHDLMDGPFDDVRRALDCACEFAMTSHLAVWLDYSADPDTHDLDDVPLYYADATAARSKSVA